MKIIEEIGKFLPIGSIIIILCSSIKQIIYYNFFGITITDYLQVQEYITLFIDDLLLYIITFGIGLSIYIYRQYYPKQVESQTSAKGSDLVFWLIVITFGILAALFLVYSFFSEETTERIEFVRHGITMSLLFIFMISNMIRLKMSYYAFMTIFFLSALIQDPIRDAYIIKENENELEYCLYFETDTIQTNDDIHYVGRTEAFTFLYSIKSDSTHIYKNESILSLGTKPRKK